MRYHRYGHVEPKKFKVGDIIEAGQLIALNGTGNGQWPAHVHYDILTYQPAKWTEFCIGKSKEWVKAHYADPRGNEKKVLPTFDHLGYGWLDDAQYAGGHAFHPGIDLNGKGSGNSDINDPVHSVCYGKIVYIHIGTDSNGGWGDMIVVEEIEEPKTEEKPKIETPAPKVDEVVPIPVKVEKTEEVQPEIIVGTGTTVSSEEIKGDVVPVDWKFIVEKIKEIINLIFKK